MTMPGSGSRPIIVVCSIALIMSAVWSVYQHFIAPILPYDDAFITYRYVDNLTHGLGLTYNPPARVWGFTSPLYTLWLALGHWLFPTLDLPSLAVRGNAVFVVAAGLGTFDLLRRYRAALIPAAVGGCLMMISPSLLYVSTGGMESVLFLALVVFTLSALQAQRHLVAGVLWGFAYLTRPEAVCLAPVFVAVTWQAWRSGLRSVIGVASIVGPWVVFTLFYYHALVPLSIVAKNRPLYPLPPGSALKAIIGFSQATVFGNVNVGRFETRETCAAILLVLAGVFTVVHKQKHRSQSWAPPLFTCSLIGLYSLTNPMLFEWYSPILTGFLLIILIVGLQSIAAAASSHSSAGAVSRRVAVGAAYGLLSCLALVSISSYWAGADDYVKPVAQIGQDASRLRTIAYTTIGQELSQRSRPGETVAAPEIGALGYAFRGYVIDACGLVSPEAIPFLPVPDNERLGPSIGAISTELVQSTRPDWVVTMPVFAARSLLVSPWFQEMYVLVDTAALSKTWLDDTKVLVYRRRDGRTAKVDAREPNRISRRTARR